MRRLPALRASLMGLACLPTIAFAASADNPAVPGFGPAVVRASPSQSSSSRSLGGGLIEYLASGASARIAPALASPPAPVVNVAPAPVYAAQNPPSQQVAALVPATLTSVEIGPSEEFQRQEVAYDGPERAGTIVIDTPRKFLFLVQPGRRAIRYGIGVGRPGFEWSGVKRISRKAEWPDWTPPPEMLLRRPDLPLHMDGGPDNPLGARALYLGSSMYRIHGTNEPSTIGQNVSSGCIRMMNEDVIDLYDRVPVGAKVIVM